MPTKIETDEQLLRAVVRATGLRDKREAVELGLRTLLQIRQQGRMCRMRDKLAWSGDLNLLRSDFEDS